MKSCCLMLVVVSCLFCGCFTSQPETFSEADRDAIRAASRDWLKAYEANDWATLAGMYTENAVLMPPNAPEIRGRDAIRRYFEENESGFSIDLTYSEIEGRGGLAYVRGSFRLTIPVDGGEPMTDVGKLLDIRVRDSDGRWLVARDMFSSDLPAEK